MEESRTMYTVVVTAYRGGNIRVHACSKHHAIQLAYQQAKEQQPDISQYKIQRRAR